MKSNFKENAYPVKALTLNSNTGQLRHTFAWSMIADSAWTLRAKKWSGLGLWGLAEGLAGEFFLVEKLCCGTPNPKIGLYSYQVMGSQFPGFCSFGFHKRSCRTSSPVPTSSCLPVPEMVSCVCPCRYPGSQRKKLVMPTAHRLSCAAS